jgi:hypothetical protein
MRKSKAALVALCLTLMAATTIGAAVSGATGGQSSKLTPSKAKLSTRALCVANQICAFSGKNYNYNAGGAACSFHGLRSFPAMLQSAVNRCGNKTNYLRLNGNRVACMNPGGNRPDPGYFNEIWVVEKYGAFC